MTKKMLFSVALLITLVSLATPAFADNVELIGATGPVVGNVYVAPYQLQDSAIQGGATINVVCDDFADDVVPGETWSAMIETFNSTGALSPGAMFGGSPNSQMNYDTAVYLMSEYLNGTADAAGMNYAIWGIFDPAVVGGAGYQSTDAAALLAGVTPSDLTGFSDYSSFGVITPTGVGSTGTEPQEYIYSTPEPSSLLLLSSGLFGLVFTKRKALQN
jgi:hypothetical protein